MRHVLVAVVDLVQPPSTTCSSFSAGRRAAGLRLFGVDRGSEGSGVIRGGASLLGCRGGHYIVQLWPMVVSVHGVG